MNFKKNVSLLIFPEGSRNNNNKTLQEFKDGAFKLAIDTNVKILPVIALHNENLKKGKSLILRPGKSKLVYLNAIDPKNFEGSVEGIKLYTFEVMEHFLRTKHL